MAKTWADPTATWADPAITWTGADVGAVVRNWRWRFGRLRVGWQFGRPEAP